MHLLVDADIVVFRFASALTKDEQTDWGGGIVSKSDNFDLAAAALDKFVKRLMGMTFATEVTMCFTDKVNFRYGVLPTYKYNRAGTQKPRLYNQLALYVRQNYEYKTKDGLEADDVLGIMATLDPHNTCIATIDKDLLQIPGRHFNWNHGWNCIVEPEDADHYFYQQILSGDPGDGYKGIPGIGAKKAEKLVKSFGDTLVWEGIVMEYLAHGLTEADALQQARVARICRKDDYNYIKKEVILWEP